MLLIEVMAARFDVFGDHDHHHTPTRDLEAASEKTGRFSFMPIGEHQYAQHSSVMHELLCLILPAYLLGYNHFD